MEKATPQDTVSVVSSEESQEAEQLSKWSPGYWNRFPFVGAIALAFIVLLAGAALGVLIGSDRVSTTTWSQRVAPNVILSALNAVSSLALALAVGEGVAIAWWRRAMKGSTVKDLHEEWELSGGPFNLITKPKSIFTSTIALAVLATQIAILNSILYQRATSTYSAPDKPKELRCIGIAAEEFPSTGYVVANTTVGDVASGDSFMLGDAYIPTVNKWQTANGFFSGYNELFRFRTDSGAPQYCDGVCLGSFEAIGFEIDCAESESHQDIALPAIAAYEAQGDESAWTDLPIFNSNFSLDYSSEARNYSQISLDLQFFVSDNPMDATPTSCPGTVFVRQCILRPAIISYPLKVTNFTNEHIINGVELSSFKQVPRDDDLNAQVKPPIYSSALKQAEGFSVVRYLYPEDTRAIRSLTSLGGLVNAFSQFLASTAAITYTGVDGSWSLMLEGTLAGRMMYGPPNMGTCDCSFRKDSLDTIIASINQLSFMTATGMIDISSFAGLPTSGRPFSSSFPSALIMGVDSNYTTTFRLSEIDATQLTDVVHYQTHYLFAGLAFGITLVCVLLVIPTFWHYGELGRRVTLGPVEIASAFGAPMLIDNTHKEGSAEAHNETIDTLIEHIGDRKIVYGFVDVEDDGREIKVQQMHLPNDGTNTAASGSPNIPEVKATAQTSSSPRVDGNIQGQQSGTTLQKRRSVRLGLAAPERVRPTSQLYSVQKSPRLGDVHE